MTILGNLGMKNRYRLGGAFDPEYALGRADRDGVTFGEALEAIYARPPEEKRQAAAAGIDFVQERYDWDVCVRTFWEPFLAEVEADLAHYVQRDA